MEGLAPPLKCLIHVQSGVQNGESVRSSLTRYLHGGDVLFDGSSRALEIDDAFGHVLRRFLFAWEQGHDWRSLLNEAGSHQRRALLEVLACGLAGQSISAHLESLRDEITNACDLEIREHLELLPLKMLAPLLLFQFPAFLLLIFGPLLRHLVEELNR